jgi:hypothetical protein
VGVHPAPAGSPPRSSLSYFLTVDDSHPWEDLEPQPGAIKHGWRRALAFVWVAVGLVAVAAVAMIVGSAAWVPAEARVAGPRSLSAGSGSAATIGFTVGRVSDVSVGCPGTGDVAEAVDRARRYVYQAFEGCDGGNGIGFARSTTGGTGRRRSKARRTGRTRLTSWR